MKKLSLIPEALPQKKSRRCMYEDALLQFANLDVESARIDSEYENISNIVTSINSVIKNSEEYSGFKAVMRDGKPYLAKVSALDSSIDDIL